MSRFTDLPARLREIAAFDQAEASDVGNWLAAKGVMEDAALKIEALERDLKRATEQTDRALDGWSRSQDKYVELTERLERETP